MNERRPPPPIGSHSSLFNLSSAFITDPTPPLLFFPPLLSPLEVIYFSKLLFTCPCDVLACSSDWLLFVPARLTSNTAPFLLFSKAPFRRAESASLSLRESEPVNHFDQWDWKLISTASNYWRQSSIFLGIHFNCPVVRLTSACVATLLPRQH